MSTKVFVVSGPQSAAHRRLFCLLSDLFNVRFEATAANIRNEIAGLIALGREPQLADGGVPQTDHVFIAGHCATANHRGSRGVVRFSDASDLPSCLRGRTLQTDEANDLQPINESTGEVLASVANAPVWTVRRSNAHVCHRVSLPLPELAGDHCLADFLNGDRFLSLLPLFHFLRGAAGANDWSTPPLRACVVVDDPNLRWTSYGRISYQRLLNWAEETPFHVSMATIPLDAMWVSSAAARLFRENAKCLSMLVHGNDHAKTELAQALSENARVATMARALQRILALERKAGIKIAKVMVPPHGACTADYMRVMLRLGFEGLTTTRSSLWRCNAAARKPVWASLDLADNLIDYFPVLMRFQFTSANAETRIAISAFLGQPLIPYGHHTDFGEEGTSFLRVVETINRLRGVQWMDLAEMLQTNYYHKLRGDTLHIKAFSRKVRVEIPEGVRYLEVELPEFQAGSSAKVDLSLMKAQGGIHRDGPFEVRLASRSDKDIVVELIPLDALDPSLVQGSCTPLSLVLRRIATEVRDRLS